MSGAALAIPYERQSDQVNRTCGAACLSMVYRSFHKDAAQNQIWPAIAKPNRFGSLSSTTHLMTQDALNRGLCAVAIQARYPLQALRLCHEWGIAAVLNHRLHRDAPLGHYTVLVDINDKDVVLHDPLLGPLNRLPHAELLDLWRPGFPNSEVAGNMLIGVIPRPHAGLACEFCHTAIPSSVECPNCGKAVRLEPGALLGCVNDACIARMWNYICCPSCDATFTLSSVAPRTAAAESGLPGGPPEPAADPALDDSPLNLHVVFAEMDRFLALVLAAPEAAAHPAIRKQLDFVASTKERLQLAQAEALVHQKAHAKEVSNLVQTARQNEAAHRQKIEELNAPLPALDGDALGRALLKNLGFLS